jgi:hypothetical protein
VIEIVDVDKTWRYDVLKFNVPLQAGVTLVIHPRLLEMTDPTVARPANSKWRVVSWSYLLLSPDSDHVEVVVEEVPEPWRSPFKNADTRFKAAVFSGCLTAFVLIAVLFLLYFMAPDARWALIGQHARWVGGWGLFLLFSIILPSRLGLSRSSSFWSTYLVQLFVMAGLVMVAVWLGISRRPCTSCTPQQYADYARALAARLKADNWPLLLTALPWAAVAFKILGLDAAEKTADTVLKAAKE